MQKFFKISLFVVLLSGLFFSRETFAQKETWAPCKGTSKVTQTGTWQTFTFKWTAAAQFDAPSTYEHETQVYDRKFADYDDGRDAWRSTLPRKYLDTQVFDCWPYASGEVDNFAVGSAEAILIMGNTQYSTYMKLKKGSANSATVRIKGQKGHRVVDVPGYPLRYSTWNVKADATSSPLCVLTAPSGEQGWNY